MAFGESNYIFQMTPPDDHATSKSQHRIILHVRLESKIRIINILPHFTLKAYSTWSKSTPDINVSQRGVNRRIKPSLKPRNIQMA